MAGRSPAGLGRRRTRGHHRARRPTPTSPPRCDATSTVLVAAWRLAEQVGAAASAVTASAAASVAGAASRRRAHGGGRRRPARLDAAAVRPARWPGRRPRCSSGCRPAGSTTRLPRACSPPQGCCSPPRAGGGPEGCCDGLAGRAARTVTVGDPGGAARASWPCSSGRAAARRVDVGRRARAALPSGPATVDEAAALAGLVAAALRSGVGAVEALEAVAEPSTPALRGASSPWWRPPTAGASRPDEAWAHVGAGLGGRRGGLARRPRGRGRAGRSAHRRRGPDARGGVAAGSRRRCTGPACCWCCRSARASCPGFVATTVAPVVLHLLGGAGSVRRASRGRRGARRWSSTGRCVRRPVVHRFEVALAPAAGRSTDSGAGRESRAREVQGRVTMTVRSVRKAPWGQRGGCGRSGRRG